MSHLIANPENSTSSVSSPPTNRPIVGLWMRSHPIRNPLWVIVIGMACFFGATALIVAWS